MNLKKRSQFIGLAIVLIIFFYFGSIANDQTPVLTGARPANWATAIQREGLPNLYKVTDDLYRGAQPTKKGIEELKKLGIKTIINLRKTESDSANVRGSGITYYHLPVFTFFPSKAKYRRFLEIVSDPANLPVFVHCRHGADRTGAAVAIYRIKIQKWDTEEAIKEMVNGGYNFHKIHSHLKRFVRKFCGMK
jgi:uncharacterized protein (TIGR01244 family)